mmetsp:Transcript_34218/g.45229  ORF Transcript_34218/g.45229 Transcript_34218/m.45229 type:complete len:243 (+) Transcript_34218:76-804(+)
MQLNLNVTRVWHYSTADSKIGRREHLHKIQLFHNQLTGQRYVVCDGDEISETQGSSTPFSGLSEIKFTMNGAPVNISIKAKLGFGVSYKYSCTVGGGLLKEMQEITGDPVTNETVLSASAPSSIKVRRALVKMDDEQRYIAYEIKTVVGQSYSVVERRYRNFEVLDDRLRSAFKGSHLLSSFPPLPGKCYNPMKNQYSKEFIINRQMNLNVYLNRLLQMPKVHTLQHFLEFLGLDSVTGFPI